MVTEISAISARASIDGGGYITAALGMLYRRDDSAVHHLAPA
ncbi:MAG TPA: hypothetical protein VKF81_18225 [Blastocatellia bacterium]|nr:hypothetical protein [Blastocatellia bacterium]